MSEIIETYARLTPRSAAAQTAAEKYIPGGNSRQAGHWLPHPLTISWAKGAHIYDLDGRPYIDLTNNFTSLVHGHCYEPIVEAATKGVASGSAWSANNESQLELAEAIVERVPGMDQIRFTNSGTEAANLALLIARIVTGRYKVLMARYGYHGSLLEFEVGAFDLEGPMTLKATYNDAASFISVLEEHGSEIAAVFLEPVMGAGGVISAEPEFLREVKTAANKAGALFVLDEVIALRLAYGGCQSLMDVTPDLTMMGKLIGGGFPVGAVGGKKEHFSIFDPKDLKAWHSGTFNANPITMRAGAIAVEHLTQERIDHMARLAEKLEQGLLLAARKAGLPCSINRNGSLLNLFFMDQAPEATLIREDQELISKFHIAAMNHRVFLAARGMMALATIYNDALIDEVIERLSLAMSDVAKDCF